MEMIESELKNMYLLEYCVVSTYKTTRLHEINTEILWKSV